MIKTFLIWVGVTTAVTVKGFQEGYAKGLEEYVPRAFEDECIRRADTIQSETV